MYIYRIVFRTQFHSRRTPIFPQYICRLRFFFTPISCYWHTSIPPKYWRLNANLTLAAFTYSATNLIADLFIPQSSHSSCTHISHHQYFELLGFEPQRHVRETIIFLHKYTYRLGFIQQPSVIGTYIFITSQIFL